MTERTVKLGSDMADTSKPDNPADSQPPEKDSKSSTKRPELPRAYKLIRTSEQHRSPRPTLRDVTAFMDEAERRYWDSTEGTQEERTQFWEDLEALWLSIPDPTEEQLKPPYMHVDDWRDYKRGQNREGIYNFYLRQWKWQHKAGAITRRAAQDQDKDKDQEPPTEEETDYIHLKPELEAYRKSPPAEEPPKQSEMDVPKPNTWQPVTPELAEKRARKGEPKPATPSTDGGTRAERRNLEISNSDTLQKPSDIPLSLEGDIGGAMREEAATQSPSKWYQRLYKWLHSHPKFSFWSGLAMAGFALATQLSGAPRLAAVFYGVAWVIWCWVIYLSLWRKTLIGSTLIMICLGCAIGAFWWKLLPNKEPADEIADKIIQRLTSTESKSSPLTTPERQQRAVAILPKNEVRPLPIPIEVNETAYFLRLSPAITEGLLSQGNISSKRIWWPAKLPELKKAGYILEMASRYEIKNYGETALLDVALNYEVSFYEGTSSQGKLISRHTHHLSIPALEVAKPFVFYIVNQTPYFAQIGFPKQAELQVVGEQARRIVQVEQSERFDQAIQNPPTWGYGPSSIDWKRF